MALPSLHPSVTIEKREEVCTMNRASEYDSSLPRWGTLTAWLRIGVAVALIACGESRRARDVSLANGFTSAREERAAKRDSVYARRLRLSEHLARTLKADSMRKLYLTALDAPIGKIDSVWYAIGCEFLYHSYQVGTSAARRAQVHLQDSLIALPGVEDRWRAMDRRLPGYGTLEGCSLPSPRPVIPDSIELLPAPNELPQ
jgi:hypothetical protein